VSDHSTIKTTQSIAAEYSYETADGSAISTTYNDTYKPKCTTVQIADNAAIQLTDISAYFTTIKCTIFTAK
jgi:hypothetical protein